MPIGKPVERSAPRNVVSEMRRARPNAGVAAWISATPAEKLFLSAVTLGKLPAGVETRANKIHRRRKRSGIGSIEDGLIAATALVHNSTVVTRNLRDFERLGVAAAG
jgi:predicted nucleic acid-binding protein